jgi:ZIP family zinc transporter
MPAHPIAQGLVAGVFIVALNMAGALLVLLVRQPSERMLDTLLGFAAGVMLYIISDEIVPETHRKGHERWATFGLMAGLIVMLYLDVALG